MTKKLKTLKQVLRCNWRRDLVKHEGIKHILAALKKNKNLVRAWMYSLDITKEDLKSNETKI